MFPKATQMVWQMQVSRAFLLGALFLVLYPAHRVGIRDAQGSGACGPCQTGGNAHLGPWLPPVYSFFTCFAGYCVGSELF